MIENSINSLSDLLDKLDENWGGDVTFFPPVSEKILQEFESIVAYRLPEIFRWLYTKKTNGLKIDNKGILSLFDENNKKTYVDNLNRFNDPKKNLFFKNRPQIFNDYLIVGYYQKDIICLSKKYQFENPLLYISSNFNSSQGVDFDRIDLNLEGFLKKIIFEEYLDETPMENFTLK